MHFKHYIGMLLPDKLFLKIKYRKKMGSKLSFKKPITYNEKLQWLKIYDRNPLYSTMVDKNEVKKYVSSTIGENYIIPSLGVWDSFDCIDFDTLPNQFVLKCTHDSGGLVICKDKSSFDVQSARQKVSDCLKHNYYYHGREWPYKSVTPRIIAEPYLEDKRYGELRDYKFFCFDGEPKLMFIAANRQSKDQETTFDFYDMQFNHLDIINGHPNYSGVLDKPLNYDLMMNLARKLSKGIPHVRIDFYEVNGKVYFGECTFYHYSGFTPFIPEKWDYILGDMLTLPEG